VISVAFERPCGFLNRHEQSPTVLDISSSRDLCLPTMVGWHNRGETASVASAAEKEIPILQVLLDIFLCRNLQFLTMLGWENRYNVSRSAIASKNEFLILHPLIDLSGTLC
jgi:hypothetical protein